MSECDLCLDQKKSHFAKIAGFKKLDKKWFVNIQVIEIVSMVPKSSVELSGDHFEYSYSF